MLKGLIKPTKGNFFIGFFLFLIVAIVITYLYCHLFGEQEAYNHLIMGGIAVVSLLLVYAIVFNNYKKEQQDALIERKYLQLQYHHDILRLLNPQAPMPVMGAYWRAAPDFLHVVMTSILRNKPEVVVECGCGVSTLVVGHSLKKNGKGRLYTFESSERFYKEYLEVIKVHGLEDVVTLMYTPIREYQLNSDKWLWYDNQLPDNIKIDFLLVDGPPYNTQKLARYPVLPILRSYLSKTAEIYVDDYQRKDEKAIVERWLEENSGMRKYVLPAEKGLAKLTIE